MIPLLYFSFLCFLSMLFFFFLFAFPLIFCSLIPLFCIIVFYSESLYEYSYLMPTFLMNGTTAACQQIFKEYLCALVFPACDGDAQACVSTCTHFKQSVCTLSLSFVSLLISALSFTTPLILPLLVFLYLLRN